MWTAYLVSVSVRLACLSSARTIKDPGHHSRFVQCLLLLAAAAPALGFDDVAVAYSHRDEPFTQGSEVRLQGASYGEDGREPSE